MSAFKLIIIFMTIGAETLIYFMDMISLAEFMIISMLILIFIEIGND